MLLYFAVAVAFIYKWKLEWLEKDSSHQYTFALTHILIFSYILTSNWGTGFELTGFGTFH